MQLRRLNGSFRRARIALDDDLSIEITVCLQAVGQPNTNQQDTEQAETSESQETKQQRWKHPEKEDRQQREHQQCLRLSSHRATNQDSRNEQVMNTTPGLPRGAS